ncbi:hypothetical protein GCM10022221_24230 [Actinocorallia aurea]
MGFADGTPGGAIPACAGDRARAGRIGGEALRALRDGQGGALLVSGTPGMGKTAFLDGLRARAAHDGVRCLSALAEPADRERPLSLAAQFTTAARAPAVDDLGGFVAFVHAMSDGAPLLLCADDVQDADAASLAWLRHVVRRPDLPGVLVVLASRDHALAARFLGGPVRVVRLTPLSVRDTAKVLAEAGVPGGRAADWRQVAGGNPLLLRALLTDHATAAPVGDAADDPADAAGDPADAAAASGDGPRPGEFFALAVASLLDGTAGRAAEGLAVLRATATPVRLERLLGLAPGTAAVALGELAGLGLTDGRLGKAVREAVLRRMGRAERAALERDAARLLHAEGMPAEVVARHLVAAGGVAGEWAVRTLREAADTALRANEPDRALAVLGSARDAARPEIRADLARAAWELDPASVRGACDALLADHRRGALDRDQVLRLVGYLLWHGRPGEAGEILAAQDADAGFTEMRLWFAYAYPGHGLRHRVGASPDGLRPPAGIRALDPYRDGALVLHALISDGPTEGATEAGESLLQGLSPRVFPVAPAIAALASFVRAARLDLAEAWCERLRAAARDRPPLARAVLAAASATVMGRSGSWEVAARRADEALGLVSPGAWGVVAGIPLAAKAWARTALGDHDGAAACFAEPVPAAMFEALPGLHYLHARGGHHLATGRRRAALADFSACGDLMASWRLDLSAALSWREGAAEALTALGRPGEADALLHGRRPDPEALSEAERRVVRLARAGRGNREIAELLFVTVSTVEQHLTHAYRKLGVRGRSGLPDDV